MSRVSPTKRKMQIKQRSLRRKKIAQLCQRYLAAKSLMEKEKILDKALRLIPWLSEKDFLARVKEKAA